MRSALAALCLLVLLSTARTAEAQDPADFPATGSISDAASGVEQTRPFWQGSGDRRWFMSGTFGLGVVNYQPRLQLGYGRPHYRWAGIEGGSTLSLSSVRMYGGARAKMPGIDMRVGVRYESQFNTYFMPKKYKYVREDIESEYAQVGRYIAAEAELNASVPFPGGSLIGVLTGMAITGVPDEYNIWEQTLRTVVAPPWTWRARLGYLAHLGWAGSMKLGAAAEVIHVPLRSLIVVRAGPLVSVGLTHHLEVNGGIMIVAASRDDIGLPAADTAQLGLVYKWASGDRWAEFP
jgi:hypothetical protein